MLKETQLEGVALTATEIAINALIETQTILQLIVKKGIVTPEEVRSTRKIVTSQPKYKQMLQMVAEGVNKLEDNVKFEELFEKSLRPGGREQLTQAEKDYLRNKVDNIIKEYKE